MKPFTKLNKTDERASLSHAELIALFEWVSVIFAYAWWAVIIVYYGLLDSRVSTGYQLSSLPIVVVSLALVQTLKLSMKENKRLLSTLSVVGLFVSGLLA